ncbi:50S ribosomal protein L22 [Patescibacteria group bacterium]|nr:50S ribosomal protein L22 [Patescibacteria group bacterium]MBU2035982.1 50S ribosomal protein L22 [Patescibacteria group bacterium]
MDIISTQKFIRLAPKKIRPVVSLVKKMKLQEVIEKLPFVNKKGAEYLLKVVKSACANAKNRGISEDLLFIKEIQVSEGPRLKRGIPVSKGQWHPIIKRMSHIRVILGVKEVKKENKKQTKKENVKTLENKKKTVKKGSKK